MEPRMTPALGVEEEPYAGEVEPRRAWVAALLTLAMPGLGHVYVGQARRGVALWTSVFVLSVAAAAVSLRLRVFLAVPAVAWLLLLLQVQVWLVFDVLRIVRRAGARYVLRPFNHPIVYAALATGLGVVPVALLAGFAGAHLVGSLRVDDERMTPELLPGDHVYFDRTAWSGSGPARGDLVVWEAPSGPAVLRVVGVPGDLVGVRQGAVILDAVPARTDRLGRVEPTDASLGPWPERLVGYREVLGDAAHVVFVDEGALAMDSADVYVGSDTYFLLADNRSVRPVLDSRQVGPVARDDILGRPLYVWLSRHPSSRAFQWRRSGIALQ